MTNEPMEVLSVRLTTNIVNKLKQESKETNKQISTIVRDAICLHLGIEIEYNKTHHIMNDAKYYLNKNLSTKDIFPIIKDKYNLARATTYKYIQKAKLDNS